MKKSFVLAMILTLCIAFIFVGCTNKPAESSSRAAQSSQSESAAESEIDSQAESSEQSADTESAVSSAASSAASSKASTPASSAAVSSKKPDTSEPAPSNVYARFKLTGGSGDVVLKDMDNLGFVGTCPLKYTNAQNGETIKNAEWKTDSKFVKYFNALHTATKILFDASEDAKAEERSTRMQTEAPFTVSAWIYTSTYTPAGSPDFRVIAAYGANGPIDHWDLKLLSNNELSFYHSAVATEDQPYDSGYILKPNTWYHVAVTFSEKQLVYYVNGKAVSTKNFKGEMEFMPTRGNFAIGGLVEGAYSFRGGIAEVCIYKGIVAPQDTTKYKIQ